jgi:hypothetical protein
MKAISLFEYHSHSVLEAFEEALDYRGLQYSAQSLYRFGFRDEAEIMSAINKAIIVCRGAQLNPKKHFRYYFRVSPGGRDTSREWRISRLGLFLVLCNGDPGNPMVGAFQLDMCRKLLKGTE